MRPVKTSIFLFFIVLTSVSFIGGTRLPMALPDVNTDQNGNLSMSFPLDFLEGTKGMSPRLALSYSSASNDGLVGKGWSLVGIDSIRRDISYGLNYDTSDHFIAANSGKLVGNLSALHTKEESFTTFYPQGITGNGPTNFIAYDKNGMRYTYGTGNSILYRGSSVRIWGLAEVRDLHSNIMTIDWVANNGELYPSEITYANGTRKIKFTYEGRSDALEDFSEKEYKLLNWRLSKIQHYSDGSLVHSYLFSYRNQDITGDSLLTKIEFEKANFLSLSTHLPIEFSYTSSTNGLQDRLFANTYNQVNGGYANTTPVPDVFKFARDVIAVYSAWSGGFSTSDIQDLYEYSRDEGKPNNYNADVEYLLRTPLPNSYRDQCNWGPLSCLCTLYPACPANIRIMCTQFAFAGGMDACNNGVLAANEYVVPTDINGDGVSEFTRILGRTDGDQAYLRTQAYDNSFSVNSPNFPLKYNNFTSFADIDGDTKTDFVYESGGILHVAFSNGSGFDSPSSYSSVLPEPSQQVYTRYSPLQAKDFFVDMNADGRSDFLHIYEDRVSIQYSQGRSFSSPKVLYLPSGARSLVNLPRNINPFQDSRMYEITDIDGDRIPELIQVLNINPPPEVSQLNAVLARQKQELAEADAERQVYKNQVTVLSNKIDIGEDSINFLSNKIHPDDRSLYWQVARFELEEVSTEQKDQLMLSIDRQFNEDKLKEIYDRQKNELDQELTRIKSVNLDNSQYSIIITKFLQNSNQMIQSEQTVNLIGFMGKNWLRDVNNDGLPDLITLTNENSRSNPYDKRTQNPNELNNVINVMINIGGSFDVSSPRSNSINTKVKPDRFAEKDDPYAKEFNFFDFHDLNEDGNVDFIHKAQGDNGAFYVYYGNGTGNYSNTLKNSFDVGSNKLKEVRFEDRNEDGTLDLFIQYDDERRTKTLMSTAQLKGGLVTNIINGVSGAFTQIDYSFKKDQSLAVQKGTGSYNTSLPSLYPSILVTRISSRVGDNFPINRQDFSYENSRYKPGDLDNSYNYGFEKIVERNYLDGTYLGKSVTTYQQNSSFYGLPLSKDVYSANDVIIDSDTSSYSFFSPNSGTRLRLANTSRSQHYINGILKDDKTTTLEYDPTYAYSPTVIEENWNGKITRKEISYVANGSLNLKALPIENKIFVNGSLVEHVKYTYTGSDIVSESKLVASNTWYNNYYTYDSFGNISTSTDSLGRSLSYEYQDLTKSNRTQTRNAIGQITKVSYDPESDLVTSEEDSNGNLVEYEYDEYDRKINTIVNGEEQESATYHFDGSQFVSTITTFTEEGDFWIKETKNLIGKTLKKESLAVDGMTLTEETRYDIQGREIQKSNAYLTGQSPVWTLTAYYLQAEDTDERPKQLIAGTGEITDISYTSQTSSLTTSYQSEVIRTEVLTKDNWDRLVTKVSQGETLRYTYNHRDQLTQVTDPGNGITTIAYDIGGRKTSQTDANSGTTSYTYNVAGELLTQTDTRGIVIRDETDGLGRVTKMTPGSESPTIYEYDTGNAVATANTLGQLSKVTDSSGISEYAYDRKGNLLVEKRTIDDIQVIFQRTYDNFDRVKTIKYPEGTLIRNHYTGTGQLGFLTIDSHDGSSVNHTLVSYEGPKLENNKYILERKTGNGVLTKIAYDPIRQRPLSYVTYLKDSTVEQSVTYTYDKKGNIATINDLMNESRNQAFEYDQLSRVTKALGKYGEENYVYHRNGNLLQKGAFTYTYDNSNHIHAVTKVNSPNTGVLGYSYDEVGNMTSRNGDSYIYNAKGKLKEIVSIGGDRFEYTYDHSGNRIKKVLKNSNTTTYSFGNLYEIYRAPGQPEKHTMFVLGVEGDIVAQYSRGDASLVSSIASNDWLVNPFCNGVTFDCGTYWKNRIGFNFITFLADTNVYIDGKLKAGHRAIPWILIICSLFVIIHVTRNTSTNLESNLKGEETQDLFGISIIPQIENYFKSQLPRYGTSLLLVIFTFTSTAGCFPLLMGAGEGESGTPVWLLGIGNGIPAHTPSVSNESSSGGGSSGSTSAGNARIDGMYFYHPDHLGSITMITDGNGNVLAGGERGGKSHITYKPYGEILRTDSYGPDITKFKYTGQEEDRESGLYYYKARYYDASLGRFISSDTEVDGLSENGMNRNMYVGGDPVSFRDPTGNVCGAQVFSAMALLLFPNPYGAVLAAGGGVSGNHTGGGQCSKLPKENQLIIAVILPYLGQIKDENQRAVALVATLLYTQSLSGKGPSPLGKLSRTELQFFLLGELNKNPDNALYYLAAYSGMTTDVRYTKSAVDKGSMTHDKFGPNVLRARNRRANSKWMGNAKSSSFSHDTWSRNHKREYNATPRKYGDARGGVAVINTIGTTFGDAIMTVTGSILFSTANVISGIGTSLQKSKMYNKNGNRLKPK